MIAQDVMEVEEEVEVSAIDAEVMGLFWPKPVTVVAEVSDMDCNCGGRFAYDPNANCMACESCGCDPDGEPVWVFVWYYNQYNADSQCVREEFFLVEFWNLCRNAL